MEDFFGYKVELQDHGSSKDNGSRDPNQQKFRREPESLGYGGGSRTTSTPESGYPRSGTGTQMRGSLDSKHPNQDMAWSGFVGSGSWKYTDPRKSRSRYKIVDPRGRGHGPPLIVGKPLGRTLNKDRLWSPDGPEMSGSLNCEGVSQTTSMAESRYWARNGNPNARVFE